MVSPRGFGDRSKRENWGLVCEIWMNNSPKLTDMLVAHVVGLLDDDAVTFTHDGDEMLSLHVLNMLRVQVRNGAFESVGKESEAQSSQIDAGVAMMLGLWGAAQFPARDAAPSGGGGGQDAINARMRGQTPGGSGSSAQDDINARLRGRA